MRVGIDSYSYHRLLGEIRPGEDDPGIRMREGGRDVIAEGRRLGVDGVSLETVFLGPPAGVDAPALAAAASLAGLELVLAWGHPEGLAFGADTAALDDLLAWIALAPHVGAGMVRLVAAGPRLRGREPIAEQIARSVPPLRRAVGAAQGAGVGLALENHADLTAGEILRLLDAVGDERLGVCFDTANALRVGDEPVAAASALSPHIRQVHLKDCAEGWRDPVTGPVSVPYGTGIVPVEEVLGVLRDAAFDGLVCVELAQLGPGPCDERSMVADGVAWLRARGDLSPPPGGAAPRSPRAPRSSA